MNKEEAKKKVREILSEKNDYYLEMVKGFDEKILNPILKIIDEIKLKTDR